MAVLSLAFDETLSTEAHRKLRLDDRIKANRRVERPRTHAPVKRGTWLDLALQRGGWPTVWGQSATAVFTHRIERDKTLTLSLALVLQRTR